MVKAFIDTHRYKLLLALFAFVLYGNTLKNGYSLDDEFVTGPKNITAKGFEAIPRVFKTFHVIDESGNKYEYRPMVKVSFAIESGLFGQNVMISHLMNILFYVICLLLMYKLLQLIFVNVSEFVIFSVVLVFEFLPIHSEVVASLKNRDVMLSFIFTMTSFIMFLKFFEVGKWYQLVIAFLCLVLAFLSKFDVLPFLAIIPMVAYVRNKVSIKQILLVIIFFFVAYYSYKITKILMFSREELKSVRVYQYFENPLYFNFGLIDRLSAGLNSMGFYVMMLFLPLKMACYYGYSTIPVFSFSSLYALIGLIVFAFLIWQFYKRFKKPDMLWYGIVFFGGSISMYLNMAAPAAGIVADRFVFFASIGFSLMCIHGLLLLKSSGNRISKFSELQVKQKMIGVVVLLVFAGMIINRNSEWKSKLLLFESDVKKYPNSVKLSLLASSQVMIHINDKSDVIPDNQKLQKVRNAEKILLNAIKIDSTCDVCYNNIAHILLSVENDPRSALPYLMKGFQRDSSKKETACNIGIAYYRLGRPEEAKYYLLKAINLDVRHEFTVPYEVLQDLFMRTNPSEGVKYFAGELKKGYHKEFLNVLLGKSFFEVGDTLNSIKYYQQALSINPNNQTVSDFVTDLEIKYHKKAW